jgi:hypothetical protein
VNRIKKSLTGWAPRFHALASLATLVMAAGAKWRPR